MGSKMVNITVTVEMVIRILNQNVEIIKKVIRNLAKNPPGERSCECPQALKNALITNPKVITEEVRQKLSLLVSKYL